VDRWGALALLATASETQIQALGNAIENYLAFQASIRVTIPVSIASRDHHPIPQMHVNMYTTVFFATYLCFGLPYSILWATDSQ
jgi:hypothetical protein